MSCSLRSSLFKAASTRSVDSRMSRAWLIACCRIQYPLCHVPPDSERVLPSADSGKPLNYTYNGCLPQVIFSRCCTAQTLQQAQSVYPSLFAVYTAAFACAISGRDLDTKVKPIGSGKPAMVTKPRAAAGYVSSCVTATNTPT